jgi:hypothetical protein
MFILHTDSCSIQLIEKVWWQNYEKCGIS